MRNTPEKIEALTDDEVFVFGSNLAGRHGAGAARLAADRFGAEYGVGEGLTGQCYAFPTLDGRLRKRTRTALRVSRDKLYETAQDCSHLTFLLTRVGTGLAGYPELVMATLFTDAPVNIIKPLGW